LKKIAGVAWKLASLVCTLYVCWLGFSAFILRRMCDQGSYSITTSDSDSDRKVKATVFTTDCGAMTATRTIIRFSNAFVDGRTFGDTVVILTGVDSGKVRSVWTNNREFVVKYPGAASLEFAVARTHGVSIKLEPE